MFLFMFLFVISGLVILIGFITNKVSEIKEEGLSKGNVAVVLYLLFLMSIAK